MFSKILKKTIISKEITIGILACAYVISFYGAILAEYGDLSQDNRAITRQIAENGNSAPAGEDWLSVEGAYCTVFYKPTANLKRIEKKLKRRRFSLERGLSSARLNDPPDKVAYRMDLLYKRAQEILDMHPADMNVKIKIFEDQKELDREYYRIFKQKKRQVSFYVYKHDTIYTCEPNISDSVMAHELGHAIIDHYFLILPPESVKEVLARYVDLHLEGNN